MDAVDFALATYKGADTGAYDTWVYYLPPGAKGFVFSNDELPGKRFLAG